MRFVIQVCENAKVTVEGKTTGEIEKGFCIFMGVGQGDTKEICDKMLSKIMGLRVFKDENDKTNLSLRDVNGSILLISQFTLYANCKKGNRPNFMDAGKPDEAEALYEYAIKKFREEGFNTQTGIFGEHMKVALTNEGPFTILLDSRDIIG